jgi:hypothetical protein
MADRAFKGTWLWDDEATGATTEFSNNFVGADVTIDRVTIDVGAVLSDDHRYQLTGSSAITLDFRLQLLTTAEKSVIVSDWDTQLLQEVIFRPLTGAKSATNPEQTFQFHLVNAATAPTTMDVLYEYNSGAIQCLAWKWDDGTTAVTRGTLVAT